MHPSLLPSDSVQRLYRPFVGHPLPAWPEPHQVHTPAGRQALATWRTLYDRCKPDGGGYVAPDGRWINPILFFGLNVCQLDIENPFDNTSGVQPPLYRPSDQEMTDELYFALPPQVRGLPQRGNALNLLEAKGRRVGWTAWTWEVYALWRLLFLPQYAFGALYPDEDTSETERALLREAYLRLPRPLRTKKTPDGVREIEITYDNKNLLQLGYFNFNEKGEKIKSEPRPYRNAKCLFAIPTAGNPGPFRRLKLGCIFLVEVGKMHYLKAAVGASEDCLRQGRNYFGHFIAGGTSDMIDNESTDYKDIYLKPKAYGFRTHFTSAAKLIDIDYHRGTYDLAAGTAFFMAERELKKAAGDTKGYLRKVQENPLNWKECFIPQTKSGYPAEKIDQQSLRIMDLGTSRAVLRGRIERVKDIYGEWNGLVQFVEDPEGPCQMLEDGGPVDGVEGIHFAAFDDYFKEGQAEHSESLGCVGVWREQNFFTDRSDLPVFIYLERPDTFQELFDRVLNVLLLYDCPLLYEWNHRDTFTSWLMKQKVNGKAQGFRLHYVNGQPGLEVKDKQIIEMTLLAERWFEAGGVERCWFEAFLDGLRQWRVRNTDPGSVFHLLLVFREIRLAQATARRLGEGEGAQHLPIGWRYDTGTTGAPRRGVVPAELTGSRMVRPPRR